jgi:hypothetical protein
MFGSRIPDILHRQTCTFSTIILTRVLIAESSDIGLREGGHRHLYHMALTDQLVIDATTHGGRARFVNHSCEPNCRIENWVVGRERRIGVFSARAIGADEELTIDYQACVYKWRVIIALIIANCSCSTRATTKNRFDFSNAFVSRNVL